MSAGSRRPKDEEQEVPRYVDVRYVAELLKVDEATVRRWVVSGEIPRPLKLGRTTRWRLSELLEWIERAKLWLVWLIAVS